MVFLPAHEIYSPNWGDIMGKLSVMDYGPIEKQVPKLISRHQLWDDAGWLFALVIGVSVLLLRTFIRRRTFYADLACGIFAILAAGGLVVAMIAASLSHLLENVRQLPLSPTPIVFACAWALSTSGMVHVIVTLVIYKKAKQSTPSLARASIRSA